ncbi:MAG: hypothetical protein HY670_09515 [Chloroflexi bacterium]|nr:hypothetical protein [Chloroflexota bacterium]
MPELPKLRVRWCFAFSKEEAVYDLAQAESSLPFDPNMATSVVVEGQWVGSYAKLIEMVAQEPYKGKEFLDVMLVPYISGG